MKQDNLELQIMLENKVDNIIENLFKLQITKPEEVSLFLIEHDASNLIALQDILEEKVDFIISELNEGRMIKTGAAGVAGAAAGAVAGTATGANVVGAVAGAATGAKLAGGAGAIAGGVIGALTPAALGAMGAMALYIYLSNKSRQWNKIYAKYKIVTAGGDKRLAAYYADKLKHLKLAMAKADNALKAKMAKMTPEEKDKFMKKKATVLAQMKERDDFKGK